MKKIAIGLLLLGYITVIAVSCGPQKGCYATKHMSGF